MLDSTIQSSVCIGGTTFRLNSYYLNFGESDLVHTLMED